MFTSDMRKTVASCPLRDGGKNEKRLVRERTSRFEACGSSGGESAHTGTIEGQAAGAFTVVKIESARF